MTDRIIQGVPLPSTKAVVIALTAIYGIGRSTAAKICKQAGLNGSRKVRDLSDDEFGLLQTLVGSYRTEGDLKELQRKDIAELQSIKCFRGLRHPQSPTGNSKRNKRSKNPTGTSQRKTVN